MIGNLLKKEVRDLSILWIPSYDQSFENKFTKLGYHCFGFDHLFLGNCHPNLVITNNRLMNLDKIINLCLVHYCNLIVIDHEEKSDVISQDKLRAKLSKVPNVLEIAINDKVHQSWGKIHDVVCKPNFHIEELKEIIEVFAEKVFVL